MAVTREAAVAAYVGNPTVGSAGRVVLAGVSWKTYECLLHDFSDRRVPRFTYDRGMLEIVSPTPKHEKDNVALSQVVDVVAEEFEIDYLPVGSTTYRRQSLEQGFEADSSFYILNERFTRDLQDIDPTVDPPPDLVIEVDVTHSSLDKLGLYATFGVPEIWRVRGDRVGLLVLESGSYRESAESQVIPALTADVLTRFLLRSRELRRLGWVKEVRAWAREQGNEEQER